MSSHPVPNGIPMPIVSLNRTLLLTGILLGFIMQQPLFTTALFLLLLPAVIWGQRASLIHMAGSRLFREINRSAVHESPVLMRFNNTIAVVMLGMAQIAFLFDAHITGWVLSAIVAVAAFVALCGFCFGCFLYFQFNLQRYRLFGNKNTPGVGH